MSYNQCWSLLYTTADGGGGGGKNLGKCYQLRNHIQAKHLDPTEKETRSGQERLFAKQNKVEFFTIRGRQRFKDPNGEADL